MSGNGAKLTGVVGALPAEARCILEAGPGAHALDPQLLVRVSGIGQERAAHTAEQLLEAGAEALLCFGVGGALDPALRCGDIVLATEVLSDPVASAPLRSDTRSSTDAVNLERIATDAQWRQELTRRLQSVGRIRFGAVMTSDELVTSAQRKQQLFTHSGALAVDMESSAVGRCAQRHGTPFMTLRVIADTAQDSLPSVLHTALGSGGGMRQGTSFWWSLLSAPRSWSGLARLGRRYRRACGVLRLCGRAGVGWTARSGAAQSA